jgi:biopolymer transport protein ExbB
MTFTELLHYLRLGGVTLAAILACSVIALAVAVERAVALWKVTDVARALNDSIARHLLRGDVAAARSVAERSDSLAADIFLVAFGRLDRPGAAGLETAVERERAQVGLKLKAHLWILGTIGATAPFIGLFGTVAGIMRSFKDLGLDVEAGGTGGTSAVMMGISEALVATAAGILVAVQAVIFYNYFQSRLGRIQVELRLLTEEFLELVRERPALTSGLSAGDPTQRAPTAPEGSA